jgi:hypothetical protein
MGAGIPAHGTRSDDNYLPTHDFLPAFPMAEVSAPVGLTANDELRLARRQAPFACIKPRVSRCDGAACAWDLEKGLQAGHLKNERSQLIERVGDFQAHENKRRDHQIKAKMHEKFETECFSRPHGFRARP